MNEKDMREILAVACGYSSLVHVAELPASAAFRAMQEVERRTIERERERLADLVRDMIPEAKAGEGKVRLSIAERAIRRGRVLTAGEKLANLRAALQDAPSDDTPPAKEGV